LVFPFVEIIFRFKRKSSKHGPATISLILICAFATRSFSEAVWPLTGVNRILGPTLGGGEAGDGEGLGLGKSDGAGLGLEVTVGVGAGAFFPKAKAGEDNNNTRNITFFIPSSLREGELNLNP
jgi:hypothetical protein